MRAHYMSPSSTGTGFPQKSAIQLASAGLGLLSSLRRNDWQCKQPKASPWQRELSLLHPLSLCRTAVGCEPRRKQEQWEVASDAESGELWIQQFIQKNCDRGNWILLLKVSSKIHEIVHNLLDGQCQTTKKKKSDDEKEPLLSHSDFYYKGNSQQFRRHLCVLFKVIKWTSVGTTYHLTSYRHTKHGLAKTFLPQMREGDKERTTNDDFHLYVN